jgi:hypothetical protein
MAGEGAVVASLDVGGTAVIGVTQKQVTSTVKSRLGDLALVGMKRIGVPS